MNESLSTWIPPLAGASATAFVLLVRVSAVFALAWLVTGLLRRHTAAVRAAVWTAAFAGAALLPLCAQWLPPFGWAVASTPPALGRPSTASPLPDMPVHQSVIEREALASLGAIMDPGAPDALGEALDRSTEQGMLASGRSTSVLQRLAAAALGLWMLGTLVACTRMAHGLARARRIVRGARPPAARPRSAELARALAAEREAQPRDARILCSEDSAAPFVWDVSSRRRAAIVLSPRMAPADLRAVLLHERAHLERRDGPVLLAARLLAACWWPTPLARLALRRLALECERACDDAVLRGGVRASAFAGTLVELASGSPLPVPAMGAPSRLATRIEALLQADVPRGALAAPAALRIAAGACALIVPLAALGPVPRTSVLDEGVPPTVPAAQAEDAGAQQGSVDSGVSEAPALQRRALLARGVAALIAHQDPQTGAWKGDVGYKLNYGWQVTAADVRHVGASALAVEALVAVGIRRGEATFGAALAAGVRYLLGCQDERGYFTANGTRMREHALALRALARLAGAEGLTPELRQALLAGVEWTLAAQGREQGGWRFTPDATDSDVIETTYQIGALVAARDVLGASVDPALQACVHERIDPSLARAKAHVAAHWVRDLEDPGHGGFRFHLGEQARITVDTTAAGLLALALLGPPEGGDWRSAADYLEEWRPRLESQLESARSSLANPPAQWTHHFLAWEADLATARALERLVPDTAAADDRARRDAWRAADLARLAALESVAEGGWDCDEGPGAAYFTAAACLRLALAGG